MDKSFEVTMTTTSEGLEFLKKESESFSSCRVEIEFNEIDLVKPLFKGDIVEFEGLYIKIDSITDGLLAGHTVINEGKS